MANVEYWLDTNCFITPHQGPYRFHWNTNLWDFLTKKAQDHIIGSPLVVLKCELENTGHEDELAKWAQNLYKEGILFVQPNGLVNGCQSEVVNHVSKYTCNNSYIRAFCDHADSWLIAYAKAYGGKIVTFERYDPLTKKPKIPNVAEELYGDIECMDLWDALDELGYSHNFNVDIV